MEIINVNEKNRPRRISTARYYFQEIVACLSMFAIIGLIFLALVIFTAPIQ